MYIIDKLISLQSYSDYNSIDFILSSYFLKNINQITNLNAIVIEKETSISKSSISRFCKRAGFHNLKNFLAEYHIESEEKRVFFNNQNLQNNYLDVENYLQLFQNYFISSEFKNIITIIQNAKTIVLYGSAHEISLFHQLIQLLIFNGKEVIYTNNWNIDNILSRINKMRQNDIFLIIDSTFHFHSFTLRSELQEGNLNASLLVNQAYTTIFIGLSSQLDYPNETYHIDLPYSQNSICYQYALLQIASHMTQSLLSK